MTLLGKIEALLFVADRPVPLGDMVRITGETPEAVKDALDTLARQCRAERSLQVLHVAGGYQLATQPEYAEIVARYSQPQKQRLTQAQLETLAIIAYRQPITMAEIENIRGVQSDSGVKTLVERRWVRELGRKPVPGRPVLYGTTDQFLHHFGLASLAELPPLENRATEPIRLVESTVSPA